VGEEKEALSRYGMDIGIAFQLMDDALDYVSEEADFGKVKGHDLEEGKMTLPLIHVLRQCTVEERSALSDIVEKEILGNDDLHYVTTLIDKYDGITYTRNRATELALGAKQQLQLFPPSEIRDALEIVADYVVSRRK
jgi:octaprenyl-diphosphate synthase